MNFKIIIELTLLTMLLTHFFATEPRPITDKMILKVTEEMPEIVNPYIKKFEKEFNTKVTTKVRVGYINPNVNGYCFFNINTVVLNSLYINEYNDTELEMLIFHELFHCHFKYRNHDDSENYNLQPASLMNSVMFDYRIYKRHRQKYLNDLKKKILTK